MPVIRSYPEVISLQATDAFLIDRIGVGTAYVEATNVEASSAWSALTGIPTIIQAIDVLTPITGKIIEFTGPTTAHLIPTPSGGGGITGPGTTHIGSLVTWNSTGGTIVADPNIIPSANGYSLISAVNYTSMRGLLGIGSIGQLSDLSTILSVGTGLSINTASGVSTISYIGSNVTTFNGRSGVVSLGVSDISPLITAGSGVSISVGSSVQISATAISSVPIGYVGAWENGITTGNVASTNTTNLNNLIASLNSSFGGTIWFNAAGPYQINGTINLKSHVSIQMAEGAYFSWTGSTSGTCFASSVTDVMYDASYQININEGTVFAGTVFRLHSHYSCKFDIYGFGVETSAGIFCYFSADSTAGQTGPLITRNSAFNKYHINHMGIVGSGIILDGLTTGYGGQPQVNTDETFENIWFANAILIGIRLESWTDDIVFTGYTYAAISGSGGVGFIINQGASSTPSVYGIHIEQMAIDTFGTGLGRYGVFLNQSKGITCDFFYQGPTAENGDIVGTLCTSYQFRQLCTTTGTPSTATADQIVYRQKGIAAPAL